MDGTILFAKYAFAPNRLNFCGPDANAEITHYIKVGQTDRGLAELLAKFTGAYPYLQFIAKANKITDPFDWRVVEAYWIGNDLLANITISQMYEEVKHRFGSRISPKVMKWLTGKAPAGAKPHHSFHVFEIYTRVGGIRGGSIGPVEKTIDQCRISWGKVVEIKSSRVKVEHEPILVKNKLQFGPPTRKTLKVVLGDFPRIANLQTGDWVSLHWDFLCDKLNPQQLINLKKWTSYHLELANQTI